LAIGVPARPPAPPEAKVPIARQRDLAEVLLACEFKAVMKEHQKAKPRVFDELNSSHRIVHDGR